MESRIALIAIVVEGMESNPSVQRINQIIGEYGEYVIGRMGIPYRERGVSLISVALDAPADRVSALSGKLGMLKGVSAKIVYANVQGEIGANRTCRRPKV